MAKNDKTLWYIGAIFLIFIVLSLYFNLKPKTLAIIESSTELQLKSEYTTYWSNNLDGGFTSYDTAGSNDKFTWTNHVSLNEGSFNIVNEKNTDGDGSVTLKENFYGKEIVFLVSSVSYGSISALDLNPDSNLLIKFVPHTLNLDIDDVYVNGRLVTSVGVTNPFHPSISAQGNSQLNTNIGIDYIGYKAQFDCNVGENEVAVQETFTQSFNIKDLSFSPTKFCNTRPFVLRNIQQGETIITPNPIPDFNRGQSLTPPANNLIVANYFTYFVQGVNNKCGLNQANVKDSFGKWICQDTIKPVQVTVQCKQDSDCPIPLKNSCPSYFAGCKANICTYDDSVLNSAQCKNEVITIVKQNQYIQNRTLTPATGSNTFTFSQNSNRPSFFIGENEFKAIAPSFLCVVPTDVDFLHAPNPKSECWQTTVNYNFNSVKMLDTETANFDLFQVQYFADGTLTNGAYRRDTDWANTFIFTIDNQKALLFDTDDSGYIIKDSNKMVNLLVTNNLPDGDIIIKINQKVKTTNQNLPEQVINRHIIKGNTNIPFSIDTSNLGINTVTIRMFYKINADREVLIESNPTALGLNYDIVTELPTTTKFVEKIVEKPVIVEKPIDREVIVNVIPSWIWVLLVIVILVMGYFIIRKYKK